MFVSRRLNPRSFLGAVFVMTAAVIVGVCLLPHSRYVRFSDLHESAVAKAVWIYERTHFDPAPLDVVFVGSSHTVFGIDSAAIEQSIRATNGREVHVANFAMQHLGRDLQYALAKAAIAARPVKLLVIEVQEAESRAQHPAFASLADAPDIVTAPMLINTNYLDNLVHLPPRQIRLFLHGLTPGAFGDRDAFDPSRYAGTHWNDTIKEQALTAAPPRTGAPSAVELDVERQHLDRMEAGKMSLPGPLKPLETRTSLIYLREMVDIARHAGTTVRFLYLPTFAAPPTPPAADFYRTLAPIWCPSDIYAHQGWWYDVAHLNTQGAAALSAWIGRAIAKEGL